MNYGRMQEKESRSPWLAIKFGCCASKEDLVDDGRNALRATGMLASYSPSSSRLSLQSALFCAQEFAVSFAD
jgi:hypothetical protein